MFEKRNLTYVLTILEAIEKIWIYPSTSRKIKASPPNSIAIEEDFDNVEEKMFKFLWSRDDLGMIEGLKAFQEVRV